MDGSCAEWMPYPPMNIYLRHSHCNGMLASLQAYKHYWFMTCLDVIMSISRTHELISNKAYMYDDFTETLFTEQEFMGVELMTNNVWDTGVWRQSIPFSWWLLCRLAELLCRLLLQFRYSNQQCYQNWAQTDLHKIDYVIEMAARPFPCILLYAYNLKMLCNTAIHFTTEYTKSSYKSFDNTMWLPMTMPANQYLVWIVKC